MASEHYDVDANGTTDGLTDGLLILRYLFGFRDTALIHGAVAPNAERGTPAAIEDHLNTTTRLADNAR